MSQWFLVISILLLIYFASKETNYFSRQVLFSWFLITPAAMAIGHVFLRHFLYRRSFTRNRPPRAIIVGLNDISRQLASEFEQNRFLGMNCLGFFDDSQNKQEAKSGSQPLQTLGNIASVAEFVKTNNVQHIYITLPMVAQPQIMALLDDLRDTTASIYYVPDIFFFDLIQSNVYNIKNIPIVALCQSPFVGINGTIKRLSDIVLSLFILLLTAPLMLLIAIGVKLSSKGPVLFKQRRYGLDGKEILVYKFRSMACMENGERVNQATRNDPRITRFGRFLRKRSMDELPQFINVLQGRMSIVGPRPHAVIHNETY
jgi:putative colanic acid biosynthesis UDP-glucose lipid carrier transferase